MDLPGATRRDQNTNDKTKRKKIGKGHDEHRPEHHIMAHG
jgi:hypothetical protein